MSQNTRYSGPTSDHFNGSIFHNLQPGTRKNFGQFLRWQLLGKKQAWPPHVENPAYIKLAKPLQPGEFAVTFVNHATMLLQFAGLNVLTDPVWSKRVSPFSFLGPSRIRAPGIVWEDLPKIDVALVSHNHYDHMDIATLKKLVRDHQSQIFCGLGDAYVMAKHGLTATEMDWWQQQQHQDLKITYVPALHWSGRSLNDRQHSLWGGFVLQYQQRTVFFAGDTGYAEHFKEVQKRFPKIDLALLPIGAYEPRWFMRESHMNPEEAVRAHQDLQARHSMGIHFGTWRLSDEGFDAPTEQLAHARKLAGLSEDQFFALENGQTRVFTKS